MDQANKGRLASLDALRGFDMFFITGGQILVAGVCAALGCGDGWLATQMKHVSWVGLAHHDTIFPLFLFLAGASWPFSLAAQEARGRTTGQIQRKIVFRTVVLFLIGLSFGGILKFKPEFRLMSVLGFIGLSWGIAATFFMRVRKPAVRLLAIAVLLTGYYCFLHFFGVAPDAPEGALPYDRRWNIVFYFDRMLWENHMLWAGFEPESLFAVPNGVALALCGMCAGTVLRSDRWTSAAKAGVLALSGVGTGVLLALTTLVLGDPVIKQLWTTSFILAAATYSLLMLALFYWVIDVLGFRRWTVVFAPVGKNSILAYTMGMMGVTYALTAFFFTGLAEACGAWGSAVKGLGSYLVVWAVTAYCVKKDVMIRV